MEEFVGTLWHRIVTRAALASYPAAAVTLTEVDKTIGLLFRAFGGDGGLRIEAAAPMEHGARRGWLQRLAGTHRRVELAVQDEQALCLPAKIDLFPDRALNRDLYIWLAALAAAEDGVRGEPWLAHNQRLACTVLQRLPGMAERYRRLTAAHLAQRPDPGQLPEDEAAQERAVRGALQVPGSVRELPIAQRPPTPVPLWLNPYSLAGRAANARTADAEPAGQSTAQPGRDTRRRRAERTEAPTREGGLLAMRLENIFSWAEYVRVDRGTEENDDEESASRAAEDLDVLSVTQDAKPAASRLRFDLDLPGAAYDDIPLGEGVLLPEWDYKKKVLHRDYCRLLPMVAAAAAPCGLPAHLRSTARRLRSQFEALAPARTWFRGQQEGTEVDLDAYLHYSAGRAVGHADSQPALYRDFRGGVRDLACLLLADLSLSTDAWVSNEARIIDVIRDSLFLFAEALSATGDRFAMYGFSSRRRDHVRFHTLKTFEEPYGEVARGRLMQIKPGYYTRMGAAIRHAGSLLARQPATHRLLLLLTDGKPNDLDQYEGRYGVEDTRLAIIEARRQGLQPFCVTIDEEAGHYLPHLFGAGGYVVIRRPHELPEELPLLYARLTR